MYLHMIRNVRRQETIKKVIEIYGKIYRDKIIDYIGEPRTTIYDELKRMTNKEEVKEEYMKLGIGLGRPITIWGLTEKEREERKRREKRINLTPQQKDVIDIRRHNLYVNLWGRGTGKTLMAMIISFCSYDNNPTLYITTDKKEKTFLYKYHLPKLKRIIRDSRWNVDWEIRIKERKKVFIAHQKNYMTELIEIKNKYPREEITVILDDYFPQGDIIIQNLMKLDNIKIVLFATPTTKKNNLMRTKEALKYLHQLYYGFYRLDKTISMKTSYYPTEEHLKQLKKVYNGNYNIPKRCINEEKLKILKNYIKSSHYETEYECKIAKTIKNIENEVMKNVKI